MADRRIIIIDDQQAIIDSVTFVLGKKGINVVGFQDGEEAIAYIKEQSYQGVLICDVQMPKIDGWDVVSRIVEEGLHLNLVINMLTAVTDPPEKSESCTPYVYEYLTKPFNNKELIELVESSFGHLREAV